MTPSTPCPRFALAFAAAATTIVLLAGCDRRPTDVPPPTSGTSTTPSVAPPAEVITPSPSNAPLAPPGTPGPAAPGEGSPSGGPTGK